MHHTQIWPKSAEHNLQGRLLTARERSDSLFQIVREDAFYDRAIPERHRIIFYLGHLEAFDRNLLAHSDLCVESHHPRFDKLFAFGIDPVGGGLPDDVPSDWPSLVEIRDYNARLRRDLDAAIERGLAQRGENSLLPLLLETAIEHRLMHLETLAYMLHQLPYNRKVAGPTGGLTLTKAPAKSRMVKIPAGTATLGQKRDESFGWDNEFGEFKVKVPDFAIHNLSVTNGDFLEFVESGGYDERPLWLDDSWDWIQSSGIRHPVFWQLQGRQWRYRGMFEEVPLPLDCPVYVSHAEATAYAQWFGKRLPTEAEFHRAAYGTPEGNERGYPWGEEAPSIKSGNFDFHSWDPIPTGSRPAGASAFGVEDLVGNGWEWTSTPFGPFPGFEPYFFYPGYSANFFDSKHYVLKGGSPRTASCMLRRSFRNWFQPHYQYVYAKFRCVEG